jgi:hypothetical protein
VEVVEASSNLTGIVQVSRDGGTNLAESVVIDGKTISLAEMYIQNKEWRDNWNDNLNFQLFSFTMR